jgi:23S rRNA (uracil1939-C5)-methyltransferase
MISMRIEKLVYPGKSLARAEDGRVALWDGGLPGDLCEVEIAKDHGRFLEATLLRISEPSAERQPSVCRYSTQCGGCQWLEAPYKSQTQWKKSFVEEALQRIGKIEALPPITFVPSEAPLFYRNRIMLRGHVGAEGDIQIGFFESHSHSLTAITQCQVARPTLNGIIAAIASLKLPTSHKKFRCTLQELAQEKVSVLLEPIEKPYTWIEPLREALSEIACVAWVGLQGEKAPFQVFEDTPTGPMYTLPGIFQQINSKQNQKVRDLIRIDVERKKPKTLLDLYCGSGNLSLQFAHDNIEVVGVEFNAQSIRAAQYTLKNQKLPTMQYLAQDAARYLQTLASSHKTFDYVLVDPPRSGMKELIPSLLQSNIPYLTYVSCNPTTLARDLGQLAAKYQVDAITAYDFFPQTYHVETVAFLSLREKIPFIAEFL